MTDGDADAATREREPRDGDGERRHAQLGPAQLGVRRLVPGRFTELERAIEGVSRRMLTLKLRQLERDGLLIRTVYPTVPPKVEYSATPMAMELRGAFEQLVQWALRHQDGIAASRAAF